MAKNATAKGSDILIWMGGHVIAYATSSSLSMSSETTETTNKDFGGLFASATVTKLSWEMSTSNLYAVETINSNEVAFDDLMSAWKNGQEVTVTIGHTQNFGKESTDSNRDNVIPTEGEGWTPNTTGWTGKAIITSLSLSADSGSNASFDATFQGVGELAEIGA